MTEAVALRRLTYSCCGRATCSDGRRQLDPKSSNGGPAPYTYTYTYIHTHTWTSRCHTLGLHVAQRIVWAPLGRGFADQAASRLLQHPADETGCQKGSACSGGQTTQRAKISLRDVWVSLPQQVLSFSRIYEICLRMCYKTALCLISSGWVLQPPCAPSRTRLRLCGSLCLYWGVACSELLFRLRPGSGVAAEPSEAALGA